jgi:hypothetical protein
MGHPDDICICMHTREVHFGRECSIVAGSPFVFSKRDCPCKQFVELGLAVPIFQAFQELFLQMPFSRIKARELLDTAKNS